MITNQANRFELNYGGKSIRFTSETVLQQERIVALANYLQIEDEHDGSPVRLMEPDTINWIKTFNPNETLYDIGANMGIFTIFSAIVAEVHVRAFEPSINEAKVLNTNIYLNELSDRVLSFGGCGLSDEQGFDSLYMQKFDDFQANFIGEKKDEYLDEVSMVFRQGCFKTSIDQLIFFHNLKRPDHIKVDVDGIEHLVIKGAQKTLEDRIPKSMNVEINARLPEHHDMVTNIAQFGYRVEGPDLTELEKLKDKSKAICNVFFYRL